MLNQITFWLQVAATVIDGLLLVRVLSLRLQKTYLFITLACLLVLFFDLVDLWFGTGSVVSTRIFLYSRFLWVALFPLLVWDVFEEMKVRISKIRRLAAGRLVSGIFFTALLAFVMAAFIDTDDASGTAESPVLMTVALVLWAGASTASLAFLITMHRILRSQPLEVPSNTSVWMRFYELSLSAEVLSCFTLVVLPLFRSELANDVAMVVFLLFGIAITLWCVWKLRRVPAEGLGRAGEQPAV